MFWVNVPVLSEQMTDTQPRLSTAFSSLMMACSLAIFCVPIACTMVTMELSASGIAATASATANISESRIGMSRYRLRRNTRPQITIMAMARRLPNWSRLICSGVFFSFVAFIRAAILPISVSMPVAVTSTTALP